MNMRGGTFIWESGVNKVGSYLTMDISKQYFYFFLSTSA